MSVPYSSRLRPILDEGLQAATAARLDFERLLFARWLISHGRLSDALPRATSGRPRVAVLCAYGLLALAHVLLVLTTTQG